MFAASRQVGIYWLVMWSMSLFLDVLFDCFLVCFYLNSSTFPTGPAMIDAKLAVLGLQGLATLDVQFQRVMKIKCTGNRQKFVRSGKTGLKRRR